MIHQISGTATAEAYFKYADGRDSGKKGSVKKLKSVDSAYVVEVSSEVKGKSVGKLSEKEIKSIKDQVEKTSSSLSDLVEKLILKQQGNQTYFSVTIQILGGNGEIVTSQTDAQQAISENGEWGVNAVSDRIVEFAKSVSDNDPSKLTVLKKAIDRGFADAGRTFGRELPDICGQTYDAVMRKLDDWAGGTSAAAE
jgi:hypothetical protein